MSISSSSLSHPVIVTRLRAAGCVFAEDEAELLMSAAADPSELAAMIDRRVAGLPLEHVVGWAEFCGLRIAVEPGVFVPRRRTEFLVGQAASLTPAGALVLDLCCGSGALAAALVAAVGPCEVHAADVDPVAVRCARHNLAPLGGLVHAGDLFDPLPAALRGRINTLVANVPYVPTNDVDLLPPEARLHEALVALDGGGDGLAILRRVAAEAARWLGPGGSLLVEVSEGQAPSAVDAFARGGLVPRVASSEEYNATVIIGTRP